MLTEQEKEELRRKIDARKQRERNQENIGCLNYNQKPPSFFEKLLRAKLDKYKRLNREGKLTRHVITKVVPFWCFILCVILMIVGTIYANIFNDLNKIYEDSRWCETPYAEVASDGSYLAIDTNPYCSDILGLSGKAGDMTYAEDAWNAIEEVNQKLGIPDVVTRNMTLTTYDDGLQTYEGNWFVMKWKYHPNIGLEVMYEKIR